MEENGVWRTISGRKVFIKDGKSIIDAMKESKKFNIKKEKQLEPTAERAWNDLPKFIDKYGGEMDGCFELMTQRNLSKTEMTEIIKRGVSKGYIRESSADRIKEYLRLDTEEE